MGIAICDKRQNKRTEDGERERERGREGEKNADDAADAGDAAAVLSWLECQLFPLSTRGVQIVTLKGKLLQYFLDELVNRQKEEKVEVHSIGPRLYSTAGQRSGLMRLMQLRRGYTHRFLVLDESGRAL
ncbi:hypothetical protein VE04_08042 [Pseudogymnoascus sp. 24MN13]|nr:hypothetical protein VE04_08042 [Pseudogymnoascus sp. 24MN13]